MPSAAKNLAARGWVAGAELCVTRMAVAWRRFAGLKRSARPYNADVSQDRVAPRGPSRIATLSRDRHEHPNDLSAARSPGYRAVAGDLRPHPLSDRRKGRSGGRGDAGRDP